MRVTAYKDWSDAQKRAHKKYDQKNYSVVGCKLPRSDADAFRAFCAAQGRSVSAVLAEYVRSCLASFADSPGPKNQAGQADSIPGPQDAPQKFTDQGKP